MLALIDGDVFAHRCCKSRFSKPASGEFTEILTIVADRSKHSFTEEEDKVYLERSWDKFREMIEEVTEAVYATDCLIAVKSDLNYRDDIYPIEIADGKAVWGYKANRWKPEGERNKFVPTIRELAVASMGAVTATYREADDLLNMWAHQARLVGDPYVIVSIDKDLDCIPGLHYDVNSKKVYEVSERTALRFRYQQLLSGDSVDNIPGIPGIGPKKAASAVATAADEDELQTLVVEMYMTAYDDNWYDMLLANGKMVHIQSHEQDYFDLRQWKVIQEVAGDAPLANVRKPASLPAKPPPVSAATAPDAPRFTAPSLPYTPPPGLALRSGNAPENGTKENKCQLKLNSDKSSNDSTKARTSGVTTCMAPTLRLKLQPSGINTSEQQGGSPEIPKSPKLRLK